MRALLGFFSLILLLPLAGFLYQWLGGLFDRRLMVPGKLIPAPGQGRLYLLKMGRGAPTVVFESGFVATSLNWEHIQNALCQEAQTVVYDRGGLGWSDCASSERTPTHIAVELRAALRAAGIEPPYLLVGHSFGGQIVRRYALEFPAEVCGLVLVDPMRTWEWPPINEPRRATIQRAIKLTRLGVWIARFGAARLAVMSLLCRSGWLAHRLAQAAGQQGLYLFGRLTSEVGKMPPTVRPGIAAHWSGPAFYRGLLAHLEGLPATVTEMHQAEAIQGIPVLILTPGSARPLSEDEQRAIARDYRQIIAENSEHWVHLDEPELVVEAIRELRREVSGETRSGYGFPHTFEETASAVSAD
jgi:pimeloyl-ACP methyl ester carboxylesterase